MHDEKYWHKKNYRRQIYLLWQLLWGLPKTLLFNIRYFGIRGLRFPVLLSYKVKLKKLSGKVKIPSSLKIGAIKLGFTASEVFDNSKLSLIWINDGIVEFKGCAGIHNGTSLRVYGHLILGDSFHTSSTAKIVCYKHIKFGNDVLLGWDVEIIDGDAHKIYYMNDIEKSRLNIDKPVIIGDRVWIGAHCKIMKGIALGSDVVVAANSLVTKSIDGCNCVIGGNPARILRQDIIWKV